MRAPVQLCRPFERLFFQVAAGQTTVDRVDRIDVLPDGSLVLTDSSGFPLQPGWRSTFDGIVFATRRGKASHALHRAFGGHGMLGVLEHNLAVLDPVYMAHTDAADPKIYAQTHSNMCTSTVQEFIEPATGGGYCDKMHCLSEGAGYLGYLIGYVLASAVDGWTEPLYTAYSSRMHDSCTSTANTECHDSNSVGDTGTRIGHVLTRPIPYETEPLYFWYSPQTRSCTGPASAICHDPAGSLARNGTVIGHIITRAHTYTAQQPGSRSTLAMDNAWTHFGCHHGRWYGTPAVRIVGSICIVAGVIQPPVSRHV